MTSEGEKKTLQSRGSQTKCMEFIKKHHIFRVTKTLYYRNSKMDQTFLKLPKNYQLYKSS